MAHANELEDRFKRLKSRLEAIQSQLQVVREDGALVVDTADLDLKCEGYQDLVSTYLQLPNTPELNR